MDALTDEEQERLALLSNQELAQIPRETSEVISVANGRGATSFELDASSSGGQLRQTISAQDLADPGIVIERGADDGGVLDSLTDFRSTTAVYSDLDFNDDDGSAEAEVMTVMDQFIEKNRKRRNLEAVLFVGAVLFLATEAMRKK